MGKRNKLEKTLMDTALPLIFKPGAVGAKRRGMVNGGKNISVGKNVT